MRILSAVALIIGFVIFWLLITLVVPASLCCDEKILRELGSKEGFVESITAMSRPYVRSMKSYVDGARKDIKNGYPKISRAMGI